MSALLMTKLKNKLKGIGNYEIELKNISINGRKTGCSGFILNPENGVVVYVNTEGISWIGQKHKNLVRFARDMKDYGGAHSRNEFATDDEIEIKIASMLNAKKRYDEWLDKS